MMQNMKFKSYFVVVGLLVISLFSTGFFFAPKPLEGKQMIDLGGYNLYMNIEGKGKPVVVLEAGYGATSEDWTAVAAELSKVATVVTYDRAYLGQSDPSYITKTAEEQVIQLHTLLKKANLRGPYILVGHSLGGVNVRVFAAKYPKEVAGIVLVDASHEDQNTRLFNVLSAELKAAYSEQFKAEGSYDEVQASLDQAKATKGALKNVPLFVVSATVHGMGDTAEAVWAELQKELAALSTKGKQFIATGSTHSVHKENPALIVQVVKEMIQTVK